jgi:hypothetical protein
MNRYEIRVKGTLDEEWSEWLGGMTIARQTDGTCLLSGPVIDQAALQGLLLKLHDLGLALVSVQCIDIESPADQNDRQAEPQDNR